ncbi:Multiple polyol-specific dehydrogenase [Pseudonocardia sp. Ae717_Ps2]|nr:Multiple polyol-specific dehydrogenase [Pseudonocardia sp. Ae717_Ps2]
MTHLSNNTLASLATIATPTYDRSRLRPGIAHFGVGNFHRAHQAVYIDRYLSRPGSEGWGIVGIGVSDGDSSRAKAQKFAEQDCLYTLTEFDPSGTAESRVIGSIIDYLHAPSEPTAVLDALSDPELRIVTLTITEGGYFTDESTGGFAAEADDIRHDANSDVPRTVFGFLVRALARRRDVGVAPFTVVSCDNLPGNGDAARRAVVGLAQMIDETLAKWIDGNAGFPNSMVDRVAPYVPDTDIAWLSERTGIQDQMPVTTESYLQWVIEDDFPTGRPDLASVGVEFTEDVRPYEEVKLRLLNASHVLLAYPSLLAGYRVVHQAMNDPVINTLLETFMTRDAIPVLEGTTDIDLAAYSHSVRRRFGNPAIGDQLLRIATDGAAKIPTFHTPLVTHQLATGADYRREAFLLACYQRYLGGVDDNGELFDVSEPTLSAAERAIADDVSCGALRIGAFGELGLTDNAAFLEEFRRMARSLRENGALQTIRLHVIG